MSAIDDIKARLDIVEIISESVQLRKTGRSYTGFCPFHPNTRTPAFTVYPDTQSFYCFGCHASGTVFDFVMRKQGLDFKEALQELAPRAGVELKPRSQEEEQQDQQRTRLLDLTSAAVYYFNYVLVNLARGQPGRDYLTQRDIVPETVELFQLGYSLNEWGHLLAYLTDKKGFEPQEVEAAGLAIYHEQHGYFDRFRGRLIFPIRNAKGEVVGFGGRAIGDAQPKYMNTPQTLLFDKSQVLYGLDLARDGIRSTDAAVVVEGYVDVITAHQHGFRNVIAPLGTALTSGHVALLKRLSHNIYLALDADAAGQKATLRGLSAFEEGEDADTQPVVTAQGMVRWQRDVTLRIIKMPPGRDPDDVIKDDPQQWQGLIDGALPVIDFYIEAYTADLNLANPQDQRAALDRLLPLINQLDSTQQRVYIAQLEQVIGIRAELILDLLHGQARRSRSADRRRSGDMHGRPREQPAPPDRQAVGGQHAALHRREDHLLAVLMRFPAVQTHIEELMKQDMQQFPAIESLLGGSIDRLFSRTENRLIWQAWQQAGAPALPMALHNVSDNEQAISQPEPPTWMQALDETLQPHASYLLQFPQPDHHTYLYSQDAKQCARHLRLEQARYWQRRLSQQAHDVEADDERERLLTLLAQLPGYLAMLSAPPRSNSWNDVRDTLHKPDF